MSKRALGVIVLAAATGLTACGGGGGDGGTDGGTTVVDDAGNVVTVDAAPPADAAPPGTRTIRIITAPYDIADGREYYECTRVTATEDLHILKITPVAPEGVHHQVFAIDPTKGTDGTSQNDCGPIGLDWKALFASGVGSPSLTMPDKVALKVAAGEQLVLNLHLYNATGTGSSLKNNAALDVLVTDDPTGYEMAGVPFVGPPPRGQTMPANLMITDSCTVSRATRFFAVFPHMHKSGKHIKIWAQDAAGTQQVVWNQDYDFLDQQFGSFTPIQMAQGDKIFVECQYFPDAATKKLGDNTDDEMCFTISYVVPAIATAFGTPFCTNSPLF